MAGTTRTFTLSCEHVKLTEIENAPWRENNKEHTLMVVCFYVLRHKFKYPNRKKELLLLANEIHIHT